MNHDNHKKTVIDHTLEQSAATPVPPEVEARLRARLTGFREKLESQGGKSPRPGRYWVLRTAVGAAACLALMAMLWFVLLGGGQQSLYAQVIRAIEEATTLHVVGQRWIDGQWVTQAQVWYDRGHGLRVLEEDREGNRHDFLDNREYEWAYHSDKGTVIRKPSRESKTAAFLEELLDFKAHLHGAKYEAGGDEVIDGVRCSLYTSELLDDEGNAVARYQAWLDDRGRLRRFGEQVLRDGEWHDDELATITYNTPVAPGHFEPDFPEGARLLVIDPPPADRFMLEDAVYTQEVLGLIFAVHELARVEDGLYYVVHSVRPSEATLQKLAIRYSEGQSQLGDIQLDSGWRRLDDGSERSHQPLNMAHHTTLEGAQITWSLLIPKGNWPEDRDNLELSIRVFTRNQLQKHYEDQGLDWYKSFKSLTVLPLPEDGVPRDELFERVLLRLQGLAQAEHDYLRSSVSGRSRALTEQEVQRYRDMGEDEGMIKRYSTRPMHNPLDVAVEQFQADIHAEIEWLNGSDQSSQ